MLLRVEKISGYGVNHSGVTEEEDNKEDSYL